MGLVAGKKLVLKVEDPEGSGRPVPGLEALAKMLFPPKANRARSSLNG
jgi:hypothetical protein